MVIKVTDWSNDYAVSNTDLATGLTKSASALSNLGNTQSQVIGMLTAGTEQLTGQASKVGKGLQSIGINIANAATETGKLTYQVGNTTRTINLLNSKTGDMRSTFDVLKDISKDWDNMNNSQKTVLASTLAG